MINLSKTAVIFLTFMLLACEPSVENVTSQPGNNSEAQLEESGETPSVEHKVLTEEIFWEPPEPYVGGSDPEPFPPEAPIVSCFKVPSFVNSSEPAIIEVTIDLSLAPLNHNINCATDIDITNNGNYITIYPYYPWDTHSQRVCSGEEYKSCSYDIHKKVIYLYLPSGEYAVSIIPKYGARIEHNFVVGNNDTLYKDDCIIGYDSDELDEVNGEEPSSACSGEDNGDNGYSYIDVVPCDGC